MPVNKNELPWKATVKAYPAIGDLQAPSGFVRIEEFKQNVGAPFYKHNIYTVPGNKIFLLNFLAGYAWQGDPTLVEFALRHLPNQYVWYTAVYGAAFELHSASPNLYYDEDEIVSIIWSGTLAATDVTGVCFGLLFDKY